MSDVAVDPMGRLYTLEVPTTPQREALIRETNLVTGEVLSTLVIESPVGEGVTFNALEIEDDGDFLVGRSSVTGTDIASEILRVTPTGSKSPIASVVTDQSPNGEPVFGRFARTAGGQLVTATTATWNVPDAQPPDDTGFRSVIRRITPSGSISVVFEDSWIVRHPQGFAVPPFTSSTFLRSPVAITTSAGDEIVVIAQAKLVNLNGILVQGFSFPQLVEVDHAGDGSYIVWEGGNQRLVRVDQFTGVQTVLLTSTSLDVRAMDTGRGDRDGDGLLDDWETNGVDGDCDGDIDLDLAEQGANPFHKDLFVEADAMNGRAPSSLNAVAAAFAAVPNSITNNPDGQPGVSLHVVLDESSLPVQDFTTVASGQLPPEYWTLKASHFGTPAERSDANSTAILEAKRRVYRYGIFADRFGPTGRAEISGNDFFTSLGLVTPPGGAEIDRLSAFMHELGHTLGLRHGGSDDKPYKAELPQHHELHLELSSACRWELAGCSQVVQRKLDSRFLAARVPAIT
jgi:hypothetical protein